MQEHSLSSTPSPAFIACRHFYDSHSDLCEVTSHCSFDFHFSNNELCLASFHVFVSHLYVSFEKCLLGLSPTFWLGCLFFWHWAVWAACAFWKLILSIVSFAIIFSHSEGCLFTLLTVSFAVQKLLSLTRFHLFTVVFTYITLGGGSSNWGIKQ